HAPATFGLIRFSLTELAVRLAAERQGAARRTPGTHAGAEALAARAVFDARAVDELEYFAPVAALPGFPKALARTLHELRLNQIDPERLDHDLSHLTMRYVEALASAEVDDRAA